MLLDTPMHSPNHFHTQQLPHERVEVVVCDRGMEGEDVFLFEILLFLLMQVLTGALLEFLGIRLSVCACMSVCIVTYGCVEQHDVE